MDSVLHSLITLAKGSTPDQYEPEMKAVISALSDTELKRLRLDLVLNDPGELDEPLFYIIRRSDRLYRSACGRWTSSRIGAGMYTRDEADHIDQVVLVGVCAVDIIPEGTSPFVAVA